MNAQKLLVGSRPRSASGSAIREFAHRLTGRLSNASSTGGGSGSALRNPIVDPLDVPSSLRQGSPGSVPNDSDSSSSDDEEAPKHTDSPSHSEEKLIPSPDGGNASPSPPSTRQQRPKTWFLPQSAPKIHPTPESLSTSSTVRSPDDEQKSPGIIGQRYTFTSTNHTPIVSSKK